MLRALASSESAASTLTADAAFCESQFLRCRATSARDSRAARVSFKGPSNTITHALKGLTEDEKKRAQSNVPAKTPDFRPASKVAQVLRYLT